MNSPTHFQENQLIQSVYSLKIYQVIVSDKAGMAKLLNINSGRVEDWNACNNPHFIATDGQLKLFN